MNNKVDCTIQLTRKTSRFNRVAHIHPSRSRALLTKSRTERVLWTNLLGFTATARKLNSDTENIFFYFLVVTIGAWLSYWLVNQISIALWIRKILFPHINSVRCLLSTEEVILH